MTTNDFHAEYFEQERRVLQRRIQSLRNDATYDYATRVALLAQAQDQLDRIDEALSCLYRGTYGFCQICGRRIEVDRLKILPMTTRCRACATGAAPSAGQAAISDAGTVTDCLQVSHHASKV
jgi:RNA polymerase-binding transcription factor DksA